jgi:hypothetical protein
MLEELIAQFKLREEQNAKLPPAASRRRIAMPEKTVHTPEGDFGKY